MRRLSIRKFEKFFGSTASSGCTHRQIAAACRRVAGHGRVTTSRAHCAQKQNWQQARVTERKQKVEAKLFVHISRSEPRRARAPSTFPGFTVSSRRHGVTLQLLWERATGLRRSRRHGGPTST